MGTNRVCTRCVMDTSAPGITFDDNGACNYCTQFMERLTSSLSEASEDKRETLIRSIKVRGKRKRYDCIVGVSGGADSSWALYLTVRAGLRPLAVHMDNGWNSELAQHNIEQLVRTLNVDLYTHVIDWGEYRKLQQAFFDADVVDVELLYDNAMLAVNYQQALRRGVKYILAGTNQSTEGMAMPPGWAWFKFDKRNIWRVWRRFGDGSRIGTFPSIGYAKQLFLKWGVGIKWISFLDYFDYDKQSAMRILQDELGWKPYPYKHYESVFTRFYQGYLLPKKFGIDKRRLHLSTLVVSGQMSRSDALADLDRGPYPSEEDLDADIQYFCRKMGWSRPQLDEYLARPEQPHRLYGTEYGWFQITRRVYKRLAGRA